MFVFSLRSSKIKIIAVAAAVAVCAGGITAAVLTHGSQNAPADAAVKSIRGSTEQERLDFITGFGWQVDGEPQGAAQIMIPAEFDEVYSSYNELQLSQGFDLQPYRGKNAQRWTYSITNYPGYKQSGDCIRANILVCDGLIIGGDVCSVELNGFMHGFERAEQ